MGKKICVYAICKNESKFVKRWLDSMQEADYIVVLDTGSTDNTFKLFKEDPRVTKIVRKVINPWRFDVARNESMKLIPEDTDICVCTDIDEVIEPGWANWLRENWGDHTRCRYPFAWSHNDLGEPQDIYTADKIHSREGYQWRFPVHEVIEPIDGFEEKGFFAGDNIYMHHLQDVTKSRSSYLPLLILGAKENPKECHCRMMLAREYLIAKDYDKALEEYTACLDYDDIKTDDRIATRIEVFGRLGDINFALQKYDDAIYWYHEFLKICNNHREPYFCLGELYNTIGLFTMAEASVLAGLKYGIRFYDWIERRDNWIAKANDILSVTYYYLGDLDKALENVKIAAEHNPNNPRIIRNMNAILLSKYEGAPVQTGIVLSE